MNPKVYKRCQELKAEQIGIEKKISELKAKRKQILREIKRVEKHLKK